MFFWITWINLNVINLLREETYIKDLMYTRKYAIKNNANCLGLAVNTIE